jgi:hypothetical protein
VSDQFVSLGVSVVLDAENLVEGTYINIDGKLLVVQRIVDTQNVYVRPVVGLEYWRYWMVNHKLLVIMVIAAVIAASIFIIR